jgi:phospholipid/cholesterol/gamma-HCH transport system ATP-binding protein
MMPSESGIVVKDATVAHGGSVVMTNVQLRAPRGTTCILTGDNGSGKSTLLHACAGLVSLARGSVRLSGLAPSTRHPYELVRRGVRIGFVFQDGGLLSTMNVMANVALPLHYHADVLDLDPSAIENRARSALERVGVHTRDLYSMPANLSFGTRRRVALARALVVQPTYLFIDDPDVGLDPETAKVLHDIIDAAAASDAVTMCIATNRTEFLGRLNAPQYVLRGGRLAAQGRVSRVC